MLSLNHERGKGQRFTIAVARSCTAASWRYGTCILIHLHLHTCATFLIRLSPRLFQRPLSPGSLERDSTSALMRLHSLLAWATLGRESILPSWKPSPCPPSPVHLHKFLRDTQFAHHGLLPTRPCWHLLLAKAYISAQPNAMFSHCFHQRRALCVLLSLSILNLNQHKSRLILSFSDQFLEILVMGS